MRCALKGSEKYCETGRGICCASCAERQICDKVCLNSPERCGYAEKAPACRVLPAPRPWKGGTYADPAKKKR